MDSCLKKDVRYTFNVIKKNFIIALIIFAVEFVFHFTFIKNISFENLIKAFGKPVYLIGNLIGLIVFIVIYSGVMKLCKEAVLDKEYRIEHFTKGIVDNWKKVLFSRIFIALTIGALMFILRQILFSITSRINLYFGSIVNEIIIQYYNAILLYGMYIAIENNTSFKNLLIRVISLILSKESIKLICILLLPSVFKGIAFNSLASYLYNNSLNNGLFSNNDMIGFFSFISPFRLPIWYYGLEWIYTSFINMFLLIYISIVHYKTHELE